MRTLARPMNLTDRYSERALRPDPGPSPHPERLIEALHARGVRVYPNIRKPGHIDLVGDRAWYAEIRDAVLAEQQAIYDTLLGWYGPQEIIVLMFAVGFSLEAINKKAIELAKRFEWQGDWTDAACVRAVARVNGYYIQAPEMFVGLGYHDRWSVRQFPTLQDFAFTVVEAMCTPMEAIAGATSLIMTRMRSGSSMSAH